MRNSPKTSEELHKNHRQRMKERIRSQGISSLQEHEVLEYLLYYAVQRRDTNPLAHRLIRHCGSLGGVLSASYEDLLTVQGVTPHIAFFLSTLSEIMDYSAAKEAMEQRPNLSDVEERKAFALSQLRTANREQACVVLMDHNKKVIATRADFAGGFDTVTIDVREIMAFCLQKQAVYLMFAHTHPNGVLTPSSKDVETTMQMKRTLQGIGVTLLDHILVAQNRTYSFTENMML